MTISEERPYPLLFTLCSCFGAFRVNAKIERGRVIFNSIANLEIRQRLEGTKGGAFGYFDRWYNWANVIGTGEVTHRDAARNRTPAVF